jgi:hypothetical protein
LQDCIRERWDRKGLRMGQVVIILKTVLVKEMLVYMGLFEYHLGIKIK